MTHRAQLLILALFAILLLVLILFPRPAASDAPVVAGAVPAGEFEPVQNTTAPLAENPEPGLSLESTRTVSPGAPAPSPSPSAPRPVSVAPVRVPTASKTGISGVASWFASPIGASAAGPALRTALGPGWRGSHVTVCAGRRCITVVLGDWCACSGRVIDLDDDQFSRLAPLSRGVVEVSVRW